MFDDRAWEASQAPSLVERALRSWLDGHEPVVALSEEYRSHGRPRPRGVDIPDHFARLLETGAEHLASAKVAYVEQGRLAAVQARELAAFATHRPGSTTSRRRSDGGEAAAR